MSEFAKYIKALQILQRYEEGYSYLQGEHDVILSSISSQMLAENTDDGRALVMLGWHVDSDDQCWSIYASG